MPKLSLAVAAVTSVLVTLATDAIAQSAPPSFPAAVMCYTQKDQSWRVGYLYVINKHGNAIYLTPNGRIAVAVNANGTVMAPTNRPATSDCFGKTLDELRANGRVMEFQRPR